MIRPQTYFSLIQWSILFTLLLCSILVNRWAALAAFSLFVAWKIYSLAFLPAKVLKKLSDGRLKKQKLRERFDHSPFSVNGGKTRLFKLAPQWPTIVLFSNRQSKLFVSRELVDKLNQDELTIVIQWCFYLVESGLANAGFKIFSIFYPWFRLLRWVDRYLLFSKKQNWLSLEWSLLTFLNLLYYPIYYGHQKVLAKLCEEFTTAKVQKLRQKIYYIVHCHESKPPAELSFMLMDPEIIHYDFKESTFGLLPTPDLVMKGN